eukprot:9496220-Pyramimonas_sp.AAC.2
MLLQARVGNTDLGARAKQAAHTKVWGTSMRTTGIPRKMLVGTWREFEGVREFNGGTEGGGG